jgi:uncharacterized membrane protein YkvA (DUF1232 family)
MDLRSIDTKHPKKGVYGVRYGWWVVICLAYMLSPIDLMPELVLGPLGFADDAGIALFGLYNFMKWLKGRRAGTRRGVRVVEREVAAVMDAEEARPRSPGGAPPRNG